MKKENNIKTFNRIHIRICQLKNNNSTLYLFYSFPTLKEYIDRHYPELQNINYDKLYKKGFLNKNLTSIEILEISFID